MSRVPSSTGCCSATLSSRWPTCWPRSRSSSPSGTALRGGPAIAIPEAARVPRCGGLVERLGQVAQLLGGASVLGSGGDYPRRNVFRPATTAVVQQVSAQCAGCSPATNTTPPRRTASASSRRSPNPVHIWTALSISPRPSPCAQRHSASETTLASAQRAATDGHEAAAARLNDGMVALLQTEDGAEGMSFIERRPTNFSGR